MLLSLFLPFKKSHESKIYTKCISKVFYKTFWKAEQNSQEKACVGLSCSKERALKSTTLLKGDSDHVFSNFPNHELCKCLAIEYQQIAFLWISYPVILKTNCMLKKDVIDERYYHINFRLYQTNQTVHRVRNSACIK